ncbi:MAG TPA: ComF family protein [Candidatus Competibacter sp.]|nr:hypothetical protein [Candidatus Competibacteraceae bacterium]HRC71509.1 ComF family protein [Candidatus Competibacter sp.]
MFSNVQHLVNRTRWPWLNGWSNRLQDALLPPLCLLCGAAGADGRDLCAGCARDLPRNAPACPSCALPLAAEPNGPCGLCLRHPPDFDRVFAPFLYRPPVDYLILGLKFDNRLSHARLLGELLADALAARAEGLPDCILPVPLHPLRLRERGFNQALELARAAARRFQVPLLADGLRRIRHTTPQTGLDARQRQTNLLGAFMRSRPLEGKRVALVDDVITTASTVVECARTLRAGGVVDIEVWAVARAAA